MSDKAKKKQSVSPTLSRLDPGSKSHVAFLQELLSGPSLEVPEEVFACIDGVVPCPADEVCRWPDGQARTLAQSVAYLADLTGGRIDGQVLTQGLLYWLENEYAPDAESEEENDVLFDAIDVWTSAYRKANPKTAATGVWVKRTMDPSLFLDLN